MNAWRSWCRVQQESCLCLRRSRSNDTLGEFCHGPACTQCSRTEAIITEPFTADDIETAINELSPCSNQSTKHATTSPMINTLTNATVASVTAMVEDDTEVTMPRRTTRSQSTRLNLAATFEGFVPGNNPNALRD